MEMEECWDTDTEVDEVNDDNIGPLLAAQPDLPTTAAAAATAAVSSPSERATAACLPHASGAHEQQQPPQQVPSGGRRSAAFSSSAAGPTGGTGGIPRTPNFDANGATLARLVSTWGPVTSQDGWRQAADAGAASPASMGGVGSGVVGQVRRGFRDGFSSNSSEASAHRGVPQGGAARGDRVGGTRASRRNRNSGGGGAQDGDRGRDHLEDVHEGGGGSNGLLTVGLPSGLSLGLGGGAEASLTGLSNNRGGGGGGGVVGEPSSSGSSDSSDEDSSPGGMEGNPPEELLRALVGARITIALLLLLMCHYIVTHLVGIAAFSMGTAIVVVLDQRLWSHSGAQTLRNRFVLLGVAVTAVVVVALSATVLSNFPQGEGLLRRLLLVAPKPPALGTVSAVIRTTIVVDIWARLLSVTVKAVLAVVSVPDRDSSGNGSTSGSSSSSSSSSGTISSGGGGGGGRVSRHGTGLFARVRSAAYRFRRRFGIRAGGRTEGSGGGGHSRESPHPRAAARSSSFDANESSGGGGSGIRNSGSDAGGGGGGGRLSSGARRAWRSWLCSSERFCGGPYRFEGRGRYHVVGGQNDGRHSASGGAGVEGGGVDGGGAGTVAFLSPAARLRRVNAVVEMAFVLYRCLLPAPVWLEFYGKDSDYFAGIYLVLKGMQVSFRVDRFVRAACYVRRGELDRGKLATPEEVAEAGSPDCSICYDRMSRPLLLPCNHLFCGECVAEWLERERTCPLCRAEVPSSNPIPRSLRDGRTTVVPQIL